MNISLNNISHKRNERGFMVISFVTVVSLTMLGLLGSIAAMAGMQIQMERELEGRVRADEIALDCIYILARSFSIHHTLRDLEGFENASIPVMGGRCEVGGVGVSEIFGLESLETVVSVIVSSNYNHTDHHFMGDSSGAVFHSKVRAEIHISTEGNSEGIINLIKI